MFYIYYVGSVDLDRKRNLIWVRSEVGRGGGGGAGAGEFRAK